jgi:hypothetical protein
MTRICSRADGEVDRPLHSLPAVAAAMLQMRLRRQDLTSVRAGLALKELLDPPNRTTEASDLGYRLTRWN